MHIHRLPPLCLIVFLVAPAGAHAAFSSTESGGSAVLIGDSAPGVDDTITISDNGADLKQAPLMPGAVDAEDFDTSVAGSQHVVNSGGESVQVLSGSGNDFVGWGTPADPASEIDTFFVLLDSSLSDTLQVDNSGDATPRDYTIGSGQITGLGGGGFAYNTGLGTASVAAGDGEDNISFNPNGPPNASAAGGGEDDRFDLPNGVSVFGVAGQAGVDTLDQSGWTTPVTIGAPGPAPDYPANATGTQGIFSMENFTTGSAGDSVFGNPVANEIQSGAGDDVVDAGAGDDDVDAGTGNNRVAAGDGEDEVDAEAGNDTVDAGAGEDEVDTGAGNDTVAGGSENDAIETLAGTDSIDAGTGDDAISAGAGDDAIAAGAGFDALDGGTGIDLATYADAPGVVSASLPTLARNDGFGTSDTFATGSIENLTGGPQADTLLGDGGPNAMIGGLGADTMFGGAGDDRLFANDGVTDTLLDCGTGADVLDRDPATIDPDSIVSSCATVNPPLTPPVSPSNEFTIGKPEKNTKNGTAKLPLTVPGPGELELSGQKVELVGKNARGEGIVKLKVDPIAKVEQRLANKGKATVTVTATFTPSGGDEN